MAMTEATWSELHIDLLNMISQRIDNDLDLISFRSVCSKWRHSSISNHNLIHTLPFTIQNPVNTSKPAMYSTSISKHTLLLIKPQQQELQETLSPWLISITKNSDGKTQLCHPLRSQSSYRFPYGLIDFDKFSVVHLGNHYAMTILQLSRKRPRPRYKHSLSELESVTCFSHVMGRKIVAVMCNVFCKLNQKGHPVLFNFRKQSWTVIPNISTYFQDICVFKKRFIAVNKIGRTVAIGPDYSMELVAEYVGGGDMKFLVESEGELLLVDTYGLHSFEEDYLRVDVYKLDENEKRWVKLKSLGDRVLFLGNECSFSASVAKGGNCIIFKDSAFFPFDNIRGGKCVFHLGQGRFTTLSDNPQLFNLFWPPPKWIVNGCSH